MENITKNLDKFYYRNRAIIENAKRCTPYKTIATYSTCNEEEIEKVGTDDKQIPSPEDKKVVGI